MVSEYLFILLLATSMTQLAVAAYPERSELVAAAETIDVRVDQAVAAHHAFDRRARVVPATDHHVERLRLPRP